MPALRLFTGLAAGALLVVGCGDFVPAEPDLAADGVTLQIISGNGQTGTPGQELAEPLVVRAMDSSGRPLNRVVVSFVPTLGGGSAWAGAANTDPHGYATDYWTLGPLEGPNRMEARVVDPSSGEKLVLGAFVADAVWDVPPSPEVCDGIDNDQDGATDENLAYCFDGAPAPNTDGAVCLAGYIDLNGDPTDGCEQVDIDGHYALDTPIGITCTDFPDFGTLTLTIDLYTLTLFSDVLLELVPWFSEGPVLEGPVEYMENPVSYDPARDSFQGHSLWEHFGGGSSGEEYAFRGTMIVDGQFVDDRTWAATISFVDMTYRALTAEGQTVEGTCTDVVDAAVKGTRK